MQRKIALAVAFAMVASFGAVLPSASEDASAAVVWDVTITYEIENGSVVDDQLDGTYSQRITCSGNWTVVDSGFTSTASDKHLHKVSISYVEGLVQHQHQEGGDVEEEQYACDDAWGTETVTLDTGFDTYTHRGSCPADEEFMAEASNITTVSIEAILQEDSYEVREESDGGVCQTLRIAKTLNAGNVPFTGKANASTVNHNDGSVSTSVESCEYVYGVAWCDQPTSEQHDEQYFDCAWDGDDETDWCKWTNKLKTEELEGMTLLPPTGSVESDVDHVVDDPENDVRNPVLDT